MGKGTDKLYITHSEWSSEDAFSAASGAGGKQKTVGASFRRLPYNFCALSLQPFAHPVCTGDGTTFDLTHILPWLKKHGTNPVDGQPLKSSELVKLHFAKNDEGEYVDPVTFKVFTDNTHIIAIRNTGNVFAYDTVERLNIKPKMWRDLVSDEAFTRADLITLQDPQNLEARNLAAFKYLKEGTSTLTPQQERERADPTQNLNLAALGNAARVLKAKEAVAEARTRREGRPVDSSSAGDRNALVRRVDDVGNNVAKSSKVAGGATKMGSGGKPVPYNAAQHTTGKAAASFTSTGLTPHTAAERALLTEEEYMLKPKRVKQKGYARITTRCGAFDIELRPEFAPRAVWNFVQLAKRGYYDGTLFHRNIRHFMLQGGDPTGTGRGGQSAFPGGATFKDEFEGPGTHDARGVVSMANKGKNTNSSQFFVTYRPAHHLDRKHTIFGRVAEDDSASMQTLSRLENEAVREADKKPVKDIVMEQVSILIDPFEEWRRVKGEHDEEERTKAEIARQGGTEDDKVTWTGKRIRGNGGAASGLGAASLGVGKYLKAAISGTTGGGGGGTAEEDEIVEEWDVAEEPARKKAKASGFGNFDGW